MLLLFLSCTVNFIFIVLFVEYFMYPLQRFNFISKILAGQCIMYVCICEHVLDRKSGGLSYAFLLNRIGKLHSLVAERCGTWFCKYRRDLV